MFPEALNKMRNSIFAREFVRIVRLIWKPYVIAAGILSGIGLVYWIATPSIQGGTTRDFVSSALGDLKVLSYTAQEYYRMNGEWPADTTKLHRSPRIHPNTPYYDAFLLDEREFYRLRNRESGIVLYSVGPDRKDDGANLIYDPSNGTESGGDIVRVVSVPG